jgi:hypothetical protein
VGNRHTSPSLLSCSFQVTGRESIVLISAISFIVHMFFLLSYCLTARFVESLENDLTVRAKTTEMKITDFSSGSYATVFRDEVFHFHYIQTWIVPTFHSHFCMPGLCAHIWALG